MMKKMTLKRGLFLLTSIGMIAIVGTIFGNQQQVHSSTTTATPAQFISKMSPDVKSVANSYKLYPSVMMAQAALESSWGNSTLSQEADNYFGIKGSYSGQSVTMQTAEYDADGQLYYTNAAFKKYPSIKASMTDNAELLRNGPSFSSTYYSGTWRENAATYSDAANALTGTYATAPTYGASLISIISQYKLDTLLDVQNLDKATYYGAAGSETGTLSSSYSKYVAYNHVKGTNANQTKYAWKTLSGKSGKKVWFDMRAVKPASKTTWYRIRFSSAKTAKKYWVYSKAVTLPTTTYQSGSTNVTINHAVNREIHNHVYNSNYLSKQIQMSKTLTGSKYSVDSIATRTQNGIKTTWYRVALDSKTKGWIFYDGVKTTYDAVKYTNVKKSGKLSTSYAKYTLYNHIKNTHFKQTETKWTALKKAVKANTAVTIDATGVKTKYGTKWDRIKFAGSTTKYWVSEKAIK
ncbi:glycoside hydrolase family 73 protein [Secundilactobacillus malefermentans]|uniref:glycoside hydrolase family 73 protein n=1 Tax=Secundilactobacillus malefermentans TaxID=176292 RepID=UPI001CDC4E68|nr:glycoside hydrolase family 73 protein [Secundilactobacillus malefermentans]